MGEEEQMATQNLGPRPSRPTDQVDVEWVLSTYPSLSTYVSASADFAISFPDDPEPNTMLLVEVFAESEVAVSLPEGTLLTVGTQSVTVLLPTKTGWFGFRYSANAGAWFLLSATAQV
jgi:hypothetical protein